MKSKTIRYLFVAIIVLLAILSITIASVEAGPRSWHLFGLAPTLVPPPTPTSLFVAPPTPTMAAAPSHLEVTTRDLAIEWALYYDSELATRDQPLTRQMIQANPDMIVVESYPTRQEAYDTYGGAILNESVSPPVWVVIIKGRVSVTHPGSALRSGSKGSDGVTYFISQIDGSLLGVWSEIAEKRK